MPATIRNLAAVVVGLSIVIPLVLLMFIGPSSRGEPRDVPIGIAGPAATVQQASATLEQRQPGAFDVTAFATAAELRDAARNRDVYGGFVLGPQPQTIIATGASPAVATALTQIGAGLAAQPGAPAAPVVDVAPPAADDERGAGFGSMLMPVFMAGVAMAVGVLPGGFWLQWLALGVGIAAIATPVAGLVRLVGPAGIGVAVLLFMLVGMPLAGVAAPPEFLPSVWGSVGQMLPLGATGTALRSAVFFGGAGSAAAFGVLAAWIALGLVLLAVPKKVGAEPDDVDSGAPEPSATEPSAAERAVAGA